MKKIALLLTIVFQLLTFEARGDTVVGIHGFLTNWSSMKSIKSALYSCGYDVCLWNYPSRRKCIEQHACDLLPLLQEIACQCPGRPIHFVTHSIGALVLRAVVNMPGCPQEAKFGRAVLLAPPNQGSCLARRFRGFEPIQFALGDKTGCQLMNYDQVSVMRFGEFPSSMQVMVIAGTKGKKIWFDGPNDGYVSVDETGLFTPYYFSCFPVSHSELLTCPAVLCCMRNFICCPPPEPAETDSGCEDN